MTKETMIYLVTIIAAAVLIKIIDLCYIFQVKEYRLDRFSSTLREDGPISTLYLRWPRFPAKSLRNFLIICISILLLAVGLWVQLQFEIGLLISGLVLVLSPLLSLLIVTVAVLLTRPFAYAVRTKTIEKAKALIESRPDIISVGISGSYGKTSTKEFLFQMLSTKYKVAKTDENKNTDVGVAQSILQNIKPDTKYFIAEVGAYRQGEVAKATKVFMPQHAIITAFGNQHLDLYGSRENLIKAEGEILEYLPEKGTAYINSDILSFAHTSKRTKARVVSFTATTDKGDVVASDTQLNSEKNLTAKIAYGGSNFTIITSLIGAHNIANILPCIAFCMDQGMTKADVITAIKVLKQIPNKLSVHKGINGSLVLNDSGNSSVDGFIAAINTTLDRGYKKNIIISKGIIELGKEKDSSYKKLNSTIVDRPIHLYTTDKLFTKHGASNQVIYFSSEKALLAQIRKTADYKTLILLEGKFTPTMVKEIILI